MKKPVYYIIYQTTNNVNGNFYIGKHRTSNLDDTYLGSGTLLRHAIKKFGRDNFSREILMLCSSKREMDDMEQLVVDSYMVMDPQCYNLALGGVGHDPRRKVPWYVKKRRRWTKK